MDQSISLYPALLSFLSFGAVLILQRPPHQPVRKLWLVSAKEAYEFHAFQEFLRIKCEIGEDSKHFILLDAEFDSLYYQIELPSGRRDTIAKELVDTAVRKKILMDVDPETNRQRKARIAAGRRARQVRAQGWPVHIGKLVIEGKVALRMTREQVMMAWGKPERIKHSQSDPGSHEQWFYGSTCLNFEDGTLTSYCERAESLFH